MMDVIEIQLGGKTYRVRPTFGAIVQIEQRCGRSVLALLSSSEDPKSLGLTDIAIVLHEALRGAGERVTFETVGLWIMEAGGFMPFVVPMAQYLTAAVRAGPRETMPTDPGDVKSE